MPWYFLTNGSQMGINRKILNMETATDVSNHFSFTPFPTYLTSLIRKQSIFSVDQISLSLPYAGL